MVAYTRHQQRKKEEGERLRGERDQVKFIDLRFDSWQVVRFRKAEGKTFHKLHIYAGFDTSFKIRCYCERKLTYCKQMLKKRAQTFNHT